MTRHSEHIINYFLDKKKIECTLTSLGNKKSDETIIEMDKSCLYERKSKL